MINLELNLCISGIDELFNYNLCSSKFLLGISVKNRLFNKDLIDKFIKLINYQNANALIVIFDIPYAFNDAAERNSDTPKYSEIKKILEIGSQKERMVRKLLINNSASSIGLKRWSDFHNQLEFIQIRNEFIHASFNSEFRNLLMSQIKILNSSSNYHFINFQIQEIPMLIYIYYILGYNIDIYPGDNFKIFNLLEQGKLIDLLPFTSNIVMSNIPLSFINCLNIQEILPPTRNIKNWAESGKYERNNIKKAV